MSLLSRVRLLIHASASETLDHLEDPRTMLSYAYEQQYELLRTVRQGLVEVATSKNQLQRQTARLEQLIQNAGDQARQALQLQREDLARLALERKQAAGDELQDLQRQLAGVEEDERRLATAEQQMSIKIEELRGRRDLVLARYTAAQAQVRVNESLTGISSELADLSRAVGRAEEKTERLSARARAIDTLIEDGLLGIPAKGDRVEHELRSATNAQAVEDQLAALKAEMEADRGGR